MKQFFRHAQTKAFINELLVQNVLSGIVTIMTYALICYAYWSEYFYFVMSVALLSSLVLVAVDAKAKNDGLKLLRSYTSTQTKIITVEPDEKEKSIRRDIVLLWTGRGFFFLPMIIIGLMANWHWTLFAFMLLVTLFWGINAQRKEKYYREYIAMIHNLPTSIAR